MVAQLSVQLIATPPTYQSMQTVQFIVKGIPTYVKDTKDFIQKLNQAEEVPENSLLVTLDVKSLHDSIPNNEGIKAVKEAHDKHPNKTITTFLSLILTLSNFILTRLITYKKQDIQWAPYALHLRLTYL